MGNTITLTFTSFASEADFPATGDANTIYCVTATDICKAWNGTAYYIYIGPHPRPHA